MTLATFTTLAARDDANPPRPPLPPPHPLSVPPQRKPRGNSGDETPGNGRPRTRDALRCYGRSSYPPPPSPPSLGARHGGPPARTPPRRGAPRASPPGQLPRSLARTKPGPSPAAPELRVTFPITPSRLPACTPEGWSAERSGAARRERGERPSSLSPSSSATAAALTPETEQAGAARRSASPGAFSCVAPGRQASKRAGGVGAPGRERARGAG